MNAPRLRKNLALPRRVMNVLPLSSASTIAPIGPSRLSQLGGSRWPSAPAGRAGPAACSRGEESDRRPRWPGAYWAAAAQAPRASARGCRRSDLPWRGEVASAASCLHPLAMHQPLAGRTRERVGRQRRAALGTGDHHYRLQASGTAGTGTPQLRPADCRQPCCLLVRSPPPVKTSIPPEARTTGS